MADQIRDITGLIPSWYSLECYWQSKPMVYLVLARSAQDALFQFKLNYSSTGIMKLRPSLQEEVMGIIRSFDPDSKDLKRALSDAEHEAIVRLP